MKTVLPALAVVCTLIAGCASPLNSVQAAIPSGSGTSGLAVSNAVTADSGTDAAALPDRLVETYYLSSEDPVKTYLQNKSIRRFFDMWLKEYMCEEEIEVHWNYDSLAPVQYLDHEFNSTSRSGETFYTCTFSTDDGRLGYIIVLYGEGKEGPYIKNISLNETTPYQYDMRANSTQIAAALGKTDLDISTASAVRVEWIDTEKNRGDRVILFTDGKNDRYICYLGDDDFIVEKQ